MLQKDVVRLVQEMSIDSFEKEIEKNDLFEKIST